MRAVVEFLMLIESQVHMPLQQVMLPISNFISYVHSITHLICGQLAYSDVIYLVWDRSEWTVNDILVLPPHFELRCGRKKTNKISSMGEFGRK